MDHSVLLISGLALLGVGALGLVSHLIRMPPIIAYMVLGVAIGPLIGNAELLDVAADIGIALLFFFLGLQFPLQKMLTVAKRVGPAGLLDVALSFGGVAAIAMLLGVEPIVALVLGGVAYASSLSITLALLTERRRMANPEAEYILALLIFEDLVAPIMVAILAGLARGEGASWRSIGVITANTALMIAVTVILARSVFGRLAAFIEGHTDKDFTVLLSVGLALASGGAAVLLGLSEVLGAFLAGIMLAETGKTPSLERLITPVRHITLPFFFVYFGTSITLDGQIPAVGMLALLIGYSMAAKLVVGVVGGTWFGLRPRVAWRSGFSLIQRGEFSVVIAASAPLAYRALSGVYIIATALIGSVAFVAAPSLARAISERLSPSRPGQVAPERAG